jgi:signal transduction histidine kinase
VEPLLALIIGVVLGGAGVGLAARWHVRRSRAKATVAERRARGAERLAEIGAMTGGLAHEIKNPLSTIGLNAQLLAEAIEEQKLPEDEKGRLSRRVGALRREAERLRGILQDFLEYAGEMRLAPQPTDLNAVVDELCDFFLPQAQKDSVRLRADLCGRPLKANVDVPLIKQAILNLMINATQAMAMGGEGAPYALGANPGVNPGANPWAEPRELIVRTAAEVDADGVPMAAVHVIDTGPGIPAEKLAQIFRPYFTTKAGGSGLGLPTSRRIVEAHHGRLDVISEVGKGTDFVLRVPAI